MDTVHRLYTTITLLKMIFEHFNTGGEELPVARDMLSEKRRDHRRNVTSVSLFFVCVFVLTTYSITVSQLVRNDNGKKNYRSL